MITAQGLHDICSEFIPCDADRLIADDTRQGYDRDACRTATDIDDHVTDGLFHVDADPQGGGHWFMNQVYFFGACLFGAVPYGSFFHFGDAGRYADHHSPTGGEKRLFGVDHLDHLPDHQFGGIEVGDNPIFERAHGADAL